MTQTDNRNTFVQGEVAWKNAKTFDIFSALWKAGAKPVAGRRYDLNGMTYQRILLPTNGVKKALNRVTKTDQSAQIYVVD